MCLAPKIRHFSARSSGREMSSEDVALMDLLKILTSQQRENMSKLSVVILQEDSHNSFSLSCCCFFKKAPLIAQRHSLNYEIYRLINQNALQLWWHRMPFSSRFRVFIIVGATSTTSQRSSSASCRCYGSLDLINCWVENLFILFQLWELMRDNHLSCFIDWRKEKARGGGRKLNIQSETRANNDSI